MCPSLPECSVSLRRVSIPPRPPVSRGALPLNHGISLQKLGMSFGYRALFPDLEKPSNLNTILWQRPGHEGVAIIFVIHLSCLSLHLFVGPVYVPQYTTVVRTRISCGQGSHLLWLAHSSLSLCPKVNWRSEQTSRGVSSAKIIGRLIRNDSSQVKPHSRGLANPFRSCIRNAGMLPSFKHDRLEQAGGCAFLSCHPQS